MREAETERRALWEPNGDSVYSGGGSSRTLAVWVLFECARAGDGRGSSRISFACVTLTMCVKLECDVCFTRVRVCCHERVLVGLGAMAEPEPGVLVDSWFLDSACISYQ